MIAPGTIVRQPAHQVSCDLNGEAVVLHLPEAVYFSMDSIGAMIWNAMRNPVTVQAICACVCEEYAVDPRQCRDDVMNFLRMLNEAGLLEVVSGDAAPLPSAAGG